MKTAAYKKEAALSPGGSGLPNEARGADETKSSMPDRSRICKENRKRPGITAFNGQSVVLYRFFISYSTKCQPSPGIFLPGVAGATVQPGIPWAVGQAYRGGRCQFSPEWLWRPDARGFTRAIRAQILFSPCCRSDGAWVPLWPHLTGKRFHRPVRLQARTGSWGRFTLYL